MEKIVMHCLSFGTWEYLIHIMNFSMLKVNSLWPSDAIWQHRSGSTLTWLMACYQMAPTHLLPEAVFTYQWGSVALTSDQFYRMCSSWHKHRKINTCPRLKTSICKLSLKNALLKLLPHLSGAIQLIVQWSHSISCHESSKTQGTLSI